MTSKLPSKMKAVVFGQPNGPLSITEKPIPEPQMGYLGNVEGIVPGHEGVGTVVAVNGVSSSFAIGDRVGFTNSRHTCGHCDVCLIGQGQFCTSGKKNQGFDIDGFFAEYVAVTATSAVRIPEGLPLEKLAPLFCAGITGFRAVKQLDVPARGIIGIFGLGGVGAFAVRFAVAMGFDVIGFDISADARASSKRLGARAAFDSSQVPDILDEIKQATGGRLLDGAVVAAGVPAAYNAAFQLVAPLKTVVAVGVPRDPIQIEGVNFITKGLRLQATITGAASDLAEMMRMVQRHEIIPEITLEPFENIPDMFLRSAAGHGGGKLGALVS